MGQTFNGSETIGEIVAGFPDTGKICREYNSQGEKTFDHTKRTWRGIE